ncbi:YraN family protein [Actinomadura barringtoniae]|uniref:UPF0102 protein J4573_49985 n=1 Tax=Actinomadura barringtoniae TaxID=1427535 RepID=A0A939PM22_9ACTN|nr:YraN family protein [Actinomadura barringtoniae]MBO2455291.1 YraN family protein [Actinomadura barringtoniae]
MNANTSLGRRGEDAAAHYLNLIGWKVVDRNWRCRLGEIDIVAHDGRAPVVCEVKTRSSDQFGSPFEAITHEKAVRLRRLAWRWAAEHGVPGASIRVDVLCLIPAPNPGARRSDRVIPTQNRSAHARNRGVPAPCGGVPAPRPPGYAGRLAASHPHESRLDEARSTSPRSAADPPSTDRSSTGEPSTGLPDPGWSSTDQPNAGEEPGRPNAGRPGKGRANASLPVVDGFEVEHIREVI